MSCLFLHIQKIDKKDIFLISLNNPHAALASVFAQKPLETIKNDRNLSSDSLYENQHEYKVSGDIEIRNRLGR